MRQHRGGLIGDMLVDSQVITEEQQQKLVEIQSRELAQFQQDKPNTSTPYSLTYGQLALRENYLDKPSLELVAALQAYDRLTLAFETITKTGIDFGQLAAYRAIDKLMISLDSPPSEPWIEKAPDQTKQFQARASLFKMLISAIEKDPTLAFSPDTFDALHATLHLIELEKNQLAQSFKHHHRYETARLLSSEPIPLGLGYPKYKLSEDAALHALAHGVEHAIASLEQRGLLSEKAADKALQWVEKRRTQGLPDYATALPAMEMTMSPIRLSPIMLPQYQATAHANPLYNTMEIQGETHYQTPCELPTVKGIRVKSSLY